MTPIYRYICTKRIDCTIDICKLFLEPVTTPLAYVAGQYVEIQVGSQWLPLSIANLPRTDNCLEFHVRHNSSHPLAALFFSSLASQKTLLVRGGLGHVTLAQAKNLREMLFLAGGTGFAPIKALLEAALTSLDKKMTLLWGIHQPQDAYELTLLKEWQTQYPFFNYQLILSGQAANWQGGRGLLHEYFFSRYVSYPLQDCAIFASGPHPMIMATANVLQKLNHPKERLISDMLPLPASHSCTSG